MKRSTARWTTALAAAALLGLPAGGWSQTPPATASPSQQPPAAAGSEQAGSAQEHIRQAQAALKDVETASLPATAKTKITELKRHVSALEKSAATAGTAGSKTPARGKASWATEVAAVDKILTELLGPATTSSATQPPGAAGTTGKAQSLTLDDATKTKLMEVRTHVTAFAASMSGSGAPKAPDAGSSATEPASAAAAATTAQPPATASAEPTSPPAQTPQTSSPSSAAAAASQAPATSASEQQPQQPPSASTADAEEVKRHLTAARESLSQLTQLPAAAQLQGEPRTQVSQLITNFNELITTKENWRGVYDKVNTNVMTLLSPAASEPAQQPSTSTPGAVGTTGAAAVGLDPAIRAKLVEFKEHLTRFEKAAGGDKPSASAETAAPPAETPAAPATAAAPSAGPATEPSAAASQPSAASQPGEAASQPAEAAAQTPAQSQTGALRHLDAIEAILNARTASAQTPAGTPASLTLEPAQIEQLRTHLAELRKAIEKK